MMQRSLFFTILSGFLLGGCSAWEDSARQSPHIIIIAIESLNFESTSCTEEATGEHDAFDELCRSSLRFTHVYAPSTLSQPTLATLLTGLDLQEHKVFHNGNQGISPQVVTLAEKALQNDYRTAFFSGGPPILAKSGFQQGFELFEDEFIGEESSYVRVGKLLQSAMVWLVSTPDPRFAMIYIPDLQFPFVHTFTDEGKEREKSVLSQKHEVGESLLRFFNQLKKKGLWNDAYIIVTGLNGDFAPSRKKVLWHENLFRENVHVPVFVKTPHMTADQQRSVDSLVPMKALGQLLKDVTDTHRVDSALAFQRIEDWSENPPLHVEVRSDWTSWWFGWAPEISVRSYDYLIFPRSQLAVYHSLVDKNETTALSEKQVGREHLEWLKYRYGESSDKAFELKNEIYSFLEVLRTAKLYPYRDMIQYLEQNARGDFVNLIAADEALATSNWDVLIRGDSAVAKYVGVKNIKSDEKVSLTQYCSRLFLDKKRESWYRRCRDPLFLSLLEWEKRLSADDAALWEKSFIRKLRFYMQYKKVAYLNLFLELNWDVDVTGLLGPSLTELYLHLPEKSHLRKKIEKYQIPLRTGFPSDA